MLYANGGSFDEYRYGAQHAACTLKELRKQGITECPFTDARIQIMTIIDRVPPFLLEI